MQSKPYLQRVKAYKNGVLSLFFPHTCVICNKELSEQVEHFCLLCREEFHFTYFEKYKEPTMVEEMFRSRLPLESVYSLLYYKKGNSTQKILHRIKYQEGQALGFFMGKMLGRRLKTISKIFSVDAIVPIPLHTKKGFIRGYNQSLLIAKGVRKVTGIPIIEALYRRKHDASQTQKSKEERHQNVQGKFALKEGKLQNHRHILIVDDVLTTGATLEVVGKVILDKIKDSKISIATIAVAHH